MLNKVLGNVWRIQIFPAFLFLLAGIEIILDATTKETILIIILLFIGSFICFSSFFVCSQLEKIYKNISRRED